MVDGKGCELIINIDYCFLGLIPIIIIRLSPHIHITSGKSGFWGFIRNHDRLLFFDFFFFWEFGFLQTFLSLWPFCPILLWSRWRQWERSDWRFQNLQTSLYTGDTTTKLSGIPWYSWDTYGSLRTVLGTVHSEPTQVGLRYLQLRFRRAGCHCMVPKDLQDPGLGLSYPPSQLL